MLLSLLSLAWLQKTCAALSDAAPLTCAALQEVVLTELQALRGPQVLVGGENASLLPKGAL